MRFAYPPSSGPALALLAALIAAAVFLTWLEYYRAAAPGRTSQSYGWRRALLATLRVLSLMVIGLFLFQPMVLRPAGQASGAVVPILVDASRSMRLADANGAGRLERASTALQKDLLPALTNR